MGGLTTPYPATAALTGHLRARGVDVRQADLSLELALRLYSRTGVQRLAALLADARAQTEASEARRVLFLEQAGRYAAAVDLVVAFLQGRAPELRYPLLEPGLLPLGPALSAVLERWEDRAALDDDERARALASFFLLDLASAYNLATPGSFGLETWAPERAETGELDALVAALAPSPVANALAELAWETLDCHRPDVVGLSVPFPGQLLGALMVASAVRQHSPETRIVLGGGYANCYLRETSDPRLFDWVDYVTLDDGERPLEVLLEHLRGERGPDRLLRTFRREAGEIVYTSAPGEGDAPYAETVAPVYEGLRLDSYLGLLCGVSASERAVWSRRWVKLTLAHGCYWRQCTFCDVNLDYVQRYEPRRVDAIVEQIQTVIAETGLRSFHFTDEAAPPALLKALSRRLIERGLGISWYTNVRFEKSFTRELVDLMARAGCVLVMGGLEVASDRILALMKKGTNVPQVVRVARRFSAAGIVVHAYLMCGFPSQTLQETSDSAEIVRQLFVHGCLSSGYWAQFVAAEHSPIGADPAAFGIELNPLPEGPRMGRYLRSFADTTGARAPWVWAGLVASLRAYAAGLELERPTTAWYAGPMPEPTTPPDFVARAIAADEAGRRLPVSVG